MQPEAGLFGSGFVAFPPRETMPTIAPEGASAGPPLSPEQIDSPTSNSFGGTGSTSVSFGPMPRISMPLRCCRTSGCGVVSVTPQPMAVSFSLFLTGESRRICAIFAFGIGSFRMRSAMSWLQRFVPPSSRIFAPTPSGVMLRLLKSGRFGPVKT